MLTVSTAMVLTTTSTLVARPTTLALPTTVADTVELDTRQLLGQIRDRRNDSVELISFSTQR